MEIKARKGKLIQKLIFIAICGIVAITGWKKELFMIYATAYAMHLIINSFVRIKYYFNKSEVDSILIALCKGIGFIFIPSLIIQKLIFNEFISIILLITMIIAMILSAIIIYIKKKEIKEEKITINNGYMHMKIVLLLTLLISGVQILQNINM